MLIPAEDSVMPLYDEIDLRAGDGTTEIHVKECSLRKNEKMNLYWRMVAGLHELGHTISKFPLCTGSRKKSRVNISDPIIVEPDEQDNGPNSGTNNGSKTSAIVY